MNEKAMDNDKFRWSEKTTLLAIISSGFNITAENLRLTTNNIADRNDHYVPINLDTDEGIALVKQYMMPKVSLEVAEEINAAIEIRKRANHSKAQKEEFVKRERIENE